MQATYYTGDTYCLFQVMTIFCCKRWPIKLSASEEKYRRWYAVAHIHYNNSKEYWDSDTTVVLKYQKHDDQPRSDLI